MHFATAKGRVKDESNHLGVMSSGNKQEVQEELFQHTFLFLSRSIRKTETKKYFWHLQEGESLKKRNHYRGNCISSIAFCGSTFCHFHSMRSRRAVVKYIVGQNEKKDKVLNCLSGTIFYIFLPAFLLIFFLIIHYIQIYMRNFSPLPLMMREKEEN